jgi:hypothetical protein
MSSSRTALKLKHKGSQILLPVAEHLHDGLHLHTLPAVKLGQTLVQWVHNDKE